MYVECAILLSEKVAMLKIASHRIYLSPNFKGSYHSPSFMRRFFTILEIVWYYMYSRLPKIDTPKIDTFYEITRNFEKIE